MYIKRELQQCLYQVFKLQHTCCAIFASFYLVPETPSAESIAITNVTDSGFIIQFDTNENMHFLLWTVRVLNKTGGEVFSNTTTNDTNHITVSDNIVSATTYTVQVRTEVLLYVSDWVNTTTDTSLFIIIIIIKIVVVSITIFYHYYYYYYLKNIC